jgi:hypothetical protein
MSEYLPASPTTYEQPLELAESTIFPETEQTVQEASVPPNPIEADVIPQTDQEITERWGKLQSRWQRLKGVASGAVGRVKAAFNREAYDPAKHNRTVQNQLYKHLDKAGVDDLLAAKDNRYQRYAEGKLGKAESARETAALSAAIVPMAVGLLAWRGVSNLLKNSAATRDIWNAVEREGGSSGWRGEAEAAAKRKRAQERGPRSANQRATEVYYREKRKKNPGPSAEELAKMRQEYENRQNRAA